MLLHVGSVQCRYLHLVRWLSTAVFLHKCSFWSRLSLPHKDDNNNSSVFSLHLLVSSPTVWLDLQLLQIYPSKRLTLCLFKSLRENSSSEPWEITGSQTRVLVLEKFSNNILVSCTPVQGYISLWTWVWRRIFLLVEVHFLLSTWISPRDDSRSSDGVDSYAVFFDWLSGFYSFALLFSRLDLL